MTDQTTTRIVNPQKTRRHRQGKRLTSTRERGHAERTHGRHALKRMERKTGPNNEIATETTKKLRARKQVPNPVATECYNNGNA
eukprot:7105755-Alexandrium_andersonii.AAC.1